MRKHGILYFALVCVVSGLLCAATITVGGENILDTGASGTDLVMSDLALRDTASYPSEPTDWTIYLHPGIRFGTDDRIIGFYDVMVPVYLSDTSMLFVNPRFSHDSMDGHEWNLGGGYRHILWNDQLMLGVNAYYDLKKHCESGMWFDQWGMGFEAMGEFDDVLASGGGLGLTGRFNFYIPIEGSKGVDGAGEGYIFRSLGIHGGTGGAVYEPLTGLDYEAGMRIPYLSDYVETWAYAGGYHYWGTESGHLDGFSGRIEVIPTDFLSLDFEYRNDNWNGNEYYGEVKIQLPFSIGNLVQGKNPFEGLGSRLGGSRDLHARMVEPVRRDIDIKIEVVESGDGTATGGLVEEVIFVSEGGEIEPPADRDGTFEHPYASIAEALGDARLGVTAFTIHVINDDLGDGVAGGGDFTTIGAVANVMIWGCGVNHPLYPVISNKCAGFSEIDSLLTLDDANAEVLGLYFNNAGGPGVTVLGSAGTRIHTNLFNTGGGDGIVLAGFADTFIYENAFAGAGGYGVNVDTMGVGLDIFNNDFSSYSGIGSFGGATDISITGNTFDVTEYGVLFAHGGFDIEDLVITNNTITANNPGGDAYGVRLVAAGAGMHAGTAANPVFIGGNTITINGDAVGGGSSFSPMMSSLPPSPGTT